MLRKQVCSTLLSYIITTCDLPIYFTFLSFTAMPSWLVTALNYLTFLLIASIHGDDECFYQNGTAEPNDYKCGEHPSPCCPDISLCMSNGLCFLLHTGTYERHTCTDSTWEVKAVQVCVLKMVNLSPTSLSTRTDVNKMFQAGLPAPKIWTTVAAGTISRWTTKRFGAVTRIHVQPAGRKLRAWSLSLHGIYPQIRKC